MPRIGMALLWAVTAAGAAAAGAWAGDAGRAAALAAFDRGDVATARAGLRREAAEAAFWLAAVETGAARKTAADQAVALAEGAGGWIEPGARGLAAAAAGDAAGAASALRQAANAAPDDARLWKLLGDALVRTEDPAGARQAYERAVALEPDHPGALTALGDLQREAGELGPAYNAYNHALGEDGRPVAALVGRATTRLLMGDREGSLADLERAARIAEPGADRYRALMGIVYVHAYDRTLPAGIERAEEAIRMWTELGRPEMAAAAANATARVLLETGDPNAGERWYERGGQIAAAAELPESQRTLWRVRELHGLARAAATRRETERARQLAEEARVLMERDTANAEHYAWIGPYLTGYLRLAERRYAEAIADLERSDTERPYIRYLIAEAYARQRDRASARDWYQRALAVANGLDPETVVVRPAARAWLERNR